MSINEIAQLRSAAERAARRIMLLLGRGRVALTRDNDVGPVQKIQVVVSAKETMDLIRLAEFGFTSRIPADGDVAIIFLNAERTYGVAVASNHQKFRLQLENDGEVAIFDAFGKSIILKKDPGGIVIEANHQPVTINHAKGLIVNSPDGDVVFNMGGKNVVINAPGAVNLTGAGGRKVVCDGDPVSGGVVHADAGQKVTAT